MQLSFNLAFRAVIFLVIVTLLPYSMAGEPIYRFAVIDASAGKRLPATILQIVLDGEEPDIKISGNVAVATGPEISKEVRVSINAGDQFAPRKIIIFPQGLKTKGVNEFFLEQRPTRFTKQYLVGGIRRLEEGDIDRGLAFFEQAFNSDPERKSVPALDDYEVILRYNYARGLQQACLLLHYGTCADALRRLEDILLEMSNSTASRIYSSNRVQPELIQQALADLKAKVIQGRYRLAIGHSEAGRYADSKAVLNGLVQDLDRNQAAFSANSLSRARLEADLSYMNTRLDQVK